MLNNYLFSIISTVISGLLILFAAFYLAKPYLDRFEQHQLIGLKQSFNKDTLPLRLQAYERLVLFIDRISPVNMLVRLNNQHYSAGELHYLVITEIKQEFQHNITQQLYVSTAAWQVTAKVKNDTISLLNSAVKALPVQATALEFSKLVLEQIGAMENSPYEFASALIREEAEKIL